MFDSCGRNFDRMTLQAGNKTYREMAEKKAMVQMSFKQLGKPESRWTRNLQHIRRTRHTTMLKRRWGYVPGRVASNQTHAGINIEWA